MRILIAAPSLERPGGITRSVQRIASALRLLGHEVFTVAPDERLFAGDVRHDPNSVRFGPSVRGTSDAAHAGLRAQLCNQLRRFSEAFEPEVLLGFYGPSAGHAAVVAGNALRKPSVVAARGNDVDRDLFAGNAEDQAAREAFTGATQVMAVSKEMVAKLETRLAVPAMFISNAVDKGLFRPDDTAVRRFRASLDLPGDLPLLGLFGEFKAKRGLERLSALRPESLAPYRFLLVGVVRPEVRALVPPDTILVEYLRDPELLRGAYGSCAAVLQPSIADGMPNVLLEAMACSRPVLASPVGGIVDLITHGQTGMLCDTPGDWERALRALGAGQLEVLGERAREAVPSPEDEARAIAELLGDAIRSYAASKASR